ncbi:MAG: hypothetical protein IPL13_13645 [Saprospiraceae bacterium]|nr:hypothetical protein [Candidatus Brachybacter algidus]
MEAPVRKWITEDLDEMIQSRLSKSNLENGEFLIIVQFGTLLKTIKTEKRMLHTLYGAFWHNSSWLEQFN